MKGAGIATLLSPVERTYTGEELRPHFLLTQLGLKGSAIAAFLGPCRVDTERLVDWEDRLAGDRIEARRMVHFLGEFFGRPSLREGVLLQRLLIAILGEEVELRLRAAAAPWRCEREGDDLFVASRGLPRRKLSVSIVTASPVSLLLHVGVNVDPAGAPVAAAGLAELGIAPEPWAESALERVVRELEDVEWACAKVRPVV